VLGQAHGVEQKTAVTGIQFTVCPLAWTGFQGLQVDHVRGAPLLLCVRGCFSGGAF
jgi:hypothetical protein